MITIVVVLLASLLGAAGVASADPSADDWYRLRVCESGNNYAINTGNGYYGAYQFDLGTWRSVGGIGYPNEASPATQDALALKLWRSRGWGPWACARIIGLRNTPVSTPAPIVTPVGSLDAVVVSGSTVTVAGWALDPNQTGASTPVHFYVNDQIYWLPANNPRDDVNQVLGIGGQHGFSGSAPLNPGSNGVCVYAIGVDPSNHTLLGCRTVQAPYPPVGSLDAVMVSGSTVTVAGWAFDPNQSGASTPVHVYVNDQGYAISADAPRADVNSVMGVAGQHGFSGSSQLQPGANSVCVYAIGVDPGTHSLLGCRTVQGPYPPVGSLDAVMVSGSTVTVAGWAFDPNQSGASTPVHFYVNDQGYAISADAPRADVNSVMGVAGQHGFSGSAQLQPNANSVCVYAIGVDPNAHTLLGCATV